ncbi:MAG: YicC/YloC family endoribonuclease [Thermoanaerobaculia bacterium]
MINSMTGFGRAAGALSARYFVAVTAKSVNHRFLEASVRLPEYLWELEPALRAIASETFSRGKVDVSIRVQRTQQPDYNVRINQQIANSVVPQLKTIANELGLGSTFSGSDLLRIPDLLQVEAIENEIQDEERDALAALTREAFAQLVAMRKREGESLHADIVARLASIRQLQQRLAAHRDEIRGELLASFQQRVQEIAASAGVEVSQDRIAQEVVMQVEKGDIAEELTRLTHHVQQMDAAVAGKEPAGKKLDFLSQEMLREINTMGSKSRAATIRSLVVELKTEVERIREQVQNVE